MLVEIAGEVIVLADSSKFQRVATTRVAALDAVDVLVVDDAVDPAELARVEDLGVRVVLVPSGSGTSPDRRSAGQEEATAASPMAPPILGRGASGRMRRRRASRGSSGDVGAGRRREER